jgi:hypothetical protein
MDRTLSPIASFSLWGTLASILGATWTWQRWTCAWENSSWKTFLNPSNPTALTKTAPESSSHLFLRSLNNSHQQEADYSSPFCNPKTNLAPCKHITRPFAGQIVLSPLLYPRAQSLVGMPDVRVGDRLVQQVVGKQR